LRRFFHLKQDCSELLGLPIPPPRTLFSNDEWLCRMDFCVCVSPRIEQSKKSTQASQKQANRVLSPTRFVFFCSALPAQFPSRETPPGCGNHVALRFGFGVFGRPGTTTTAANLSRDTVVVMAVALFKCLHRPNCRNAVSIIPETFYFYFFTDTHIDWHGKPSQERGDWFSKWKMATRQSAAMKSY